MRKLILGIMIFWIVSCSSSSSEIEQTTNSVIIDNDSAIEIKEAYYNWEIYDVNKMIQTHFSDWLKYYNKVYGDFNFDRFDVTNSIEFSNYSDNGEIDFSYLKEYKGLLFESPNSDKILDIYSQKIAIDDTAGSRFGLIDTDSEIFYFDKIKKIRQRIIYGGVAYLYEEAIWLSDSTIMIVGSKIETEGKLSLYCWVADLNSNLINQTFKTFTKKSSGNYLFDIKMKVLGIKIIE